ncbi:hypothetical protein ALC57_05535 [Trachymyrmex cornetzi]|uniref:Helix-turn-helix domain-containing protein n=1 Tax=Trachymyrmex cornetzi TaxID=471704 RepID=A0A151JAJ4_9HYME|nr:hypothetical protein ALC57_05535 [Trachymyrmex cornetzi]
MDYINVEYNVNTLNNKWFVNLTGCKIPNFAHATLQLGENFSLPYDDTKRITIETIKNLQHNFKKIKDINVSEITNNFVTFINHIKFNNNEIEKKIIKMFILTKKFARSNPNVIYTHADKRNITVAINKDDYVNKMNSMLEDESTYTIINRNTSNKIISKLKETLKRWGDQEYINDTRYDWLNCANPILPSVYGVSKVHKNGSPLRIIVSYIGSILHNIATYLHIISLKSYMGRNKYTVNNSFKVTKIAHLLKLKTDDQLYSLDAVSLYTNILVELAIKGINDRPDLIKNINTKIGVIYSLTDRVLLLLHPCFHKNNLDKIIRILLDNGYALQLIINTIKKRVRKKLDQSNNKDINNATDTRNDNEICNLFVIPYISSLANKIQNLFRNMNNVRVAYKGLNKLNNLIKVQKDRMNKFQKCNVVYKIPCNDCNATYVGQTGRMLKIKIAEHKNHIKWDL